MMLREERREISGRRMVQSSTWNVLVGRNVFLLTNKKVGRNVFTWEVMLPVSFYFLFLV